MDDVNPCVLLSQFSCDTFTSPIKNYHRLSHLEGLELADNRNNPDGSIDLLIGPDHYWNLVSGGTRTGVGGPTAVSSSLGRLLSGAVNDKESGVHSNLIISRPTEALKLMKPIWSKTIKRLWETEVIGIKELSSQEVEESSIILQYHTRIIDMKLPAVLTWKENALQITNTKATIVSTTKTIRRTRIASMI